MSNDLQLIESEIYGLEQHFREALVAPSLNFAAEAGFAVQVLASNPYALKVARENKASVIAAVMNIAAIGISLNPAKKQAYLVPRDGKICLDISYMGLMDLAVDSGSILWAQAHVVFADDTFKVTGYDRPPLHEFDPFKPDRGDCVGAYVVAKTRDGDYLTHTMDIASIYSIRDRSSAWKAVQEKKAKTCPWLTDPGEMIKKTVVKQASKYWPTSDRLSKAIHHLNTDAGEGLAELAGNAAPAADPVDDAAAQLLRTLLEDLKEKLTDEDARLHYVNNTKKLGDLKLQAKFKAAVVAHRTALKEGVTA